MTNIERHLREAQEIEAKATPIRDADGNEYVQSTRVICDLSTGKHRHIDIKPVDYEAQFEEFARNTFAQRTEVIRVLVEAVEDFANPTAYMWEPSPSTSGLNSDNERKLKMAREALAKVNALFGARDGEESFNK